MTSSYRSSRPPWRSPSQSYPSTAERPSTTSSGTNSSRFLSGSSYRALTGNSALPTRTYGDSGSVTALKDKFSTMARDKAVLADKRMRIAASGFGNKASLKPGTTSRYGSSPAKSPVKEHPVTVFGVCNVPEIRTENPADIMVSVVTRGTSPTPPAHSTFLRSKHAGQQEVTMSMVPRKFERGVHVILQTDEKFLRSMPSIKNSSIPVARYKGNRPGYNCSSSKDSGSTSENSGQDQDSHFSDSSNQSKSRSSGTDSSKLPQPNGTRKRSSEKSREELSISRSPSVSSTAEEKPPSGRKAEEPKLVTIRSIAPVTGIAVISEIPRPQYPIKKNMDSSDETWWLQDSSNKEYINNKEQAMSPMDNNSYNKEHSSDSSYSSKIPTYNIRKMDSSDRHQWLKEATEPVVNHEELLSYPESTSCSESLKSNSTSSKSHAYALRKMDSSDRNQWLLDAVQHDSSLSQSDSISNSDLVNSYSHSNLSRSPTNSFRRIDNADDKQWLNEVERQEAILQNSLLYGDNVTKSDCNSLSVKSPTYKVRKMDSFEAPWWLNDEKNASDESKLSSNKTESPRGDHNATRSPDLTMPYGVRKMDSFDSPWWLSGDEGQQVNSASDNSINKPNAVNSCDNQCNLKNGFRPQLETEHPKQNGIIYSDETDNYLDVRHLYSWNNDDPSIKTKDFSKPQWWAENYQNTDTSMSTDRSRDGSEPQDPSKNPKMGNPLAPIRGVRKMDSYESPSWLASEESEPQSHEPKYTSTGDGLSSSSKQNNESVDNSPDWWGDKNDSDDFVRVKRTSIRIKKIESVNEEPVENRPTSAAKEPNLQDELDQLMLFIGGCRNIDEILGNEEPPPAAPTTPPDSDSDDCVEIGVDQVHIHDSRAQTSTIQNKLCMVSA